MIFDFKNAQITNMDLTTEQALSALSALNLRFEDGSFKFTAPADFADMTINVVWQDSVSIMGGGSENLINIYTNSAWKNTKYTHNLLCSPGQEIVIPWSVAEAITWFALTATIITNSYAQASGYLVVDDPAQLESSGNNGGGGGETTNPDDNEEGGTVGGGAVVPDEGGNGETEPEEPEPGDNDEEVGDGGEKPKDEINFIYPIGIIDRTALPVANVGFQGLQNQTGYSHVRIIVAEIHEDGTVGGSGHVWQSPFYPKDIDYTTTLDSLIPMCEGKELTHFNVTFYFLQENETGEFDFVSGYIVGGATTETTFSVKDVVVPLVSIGIDEKAYCLSPVIMTINRRESPKIEAVSVEIGDVSAKHEFWPDKNLLEIDLAVYLQNLFANVDLFEFQTLETTVVVKFYDGEMSLLLTHSLRLECVYGKKPEAEIPEHLRVQWLDKFGNLHDVTFKVFQNVAEGASAQKYVVHREEHEDKNGERSISLAYVGANASQRIVLETIVFSDHVRALFGNVWKRVKVANSYKNGAGRITKNFEITIKYSI